MGSLSRSHPLWLGDRMPIDQHRGPRGRMPDVKTDALQVLLLEEHPSVAERVAECVTRRPGGSQIRLKHVTTLHDASIALLGRRYDAVLVDLALPDCAPLQALAHVQHHAPTTPVIVLHGQCDEDLALE